MKQLIRRALRLRGYDLTQFPGPETLGTHLVRMFSDLGVTCVLDVGANEGQCANQLRSLGYSGRIGSFEPVAATYAKLARQCEADPNWVARQLALGSHSGTLRLNVTRGNDLTSALSPNAYSRERFYEQAEVCGSEDVQVRRLDETFAEATKGIDRPVVFLKLDTQGYDMQVIDGAAQCLSCIAGLRSELSIVPIYEGMTDYLSALSHLRNQGFEPTGIFANNRTKELVLIEVDCVLRRVRAASRRPCQ